MNRILCVLAPVSLLVLAPMALACPGDCNADGAITIDEVLYGVGLALADSGLGECPGIDRDGDGRVSVSDLVGAVGSALAGCLATPTATSSSPPTAIPSPTRSATPPPSATPTPTSSPTWSPIPTSTPTPVPTVNRPPQLPAPLVYRSYPGFPIEFEIGAVDPEGTAVHCTAGELPAGALLDAASQFFTWTPSNQQVGAFYVPFVCSDDSEQALSAEGLLTLQLSPLDSCVQPDCDPASGCESTQPSVDEPCCLADPAMRLSEPEAGCPEGKVAFVGRNIRGIGRLQNCDWMQVRNFQQAGAEVRFHVAARCLSTLNRVTVHTHMETAERLLFDDSRQVFLEDRPDGLDQRLELRVPIESEGPFFDLEEAEANLTVTLTDSLGVSVSESVRLRLTFDAQPDLPDEPLDPFD